MHFSLVDRVLELSDTRIVTLKHVSSAEEYLQDHFPTFPVLPGVMMIEAMVQAARRLIAQGQRDPQRYVLGQARAVKYGAFVAPGSSLRVEVEILKRDGQAFECKGQGLLIDPSRPARDGDELPTAVSGRLVMRPVTIAARVRA